MAGHTASPTVRKPMNPGVQLTFSCSVKPLSPLSTLASPDSGFFFNKSFVEIENTHNIKTLSNCIIPSFLVYSQNYGTVATISEHRGETAERLTAPTSLSERWDLCQIPTNGSQRLYLQLQETQHPFQPL